MGSSRLGRKEGRFYHTGTRMNEKEPRGQSDRRMNEKHQRGQSSSRNYGRLSFFFPTARGSYSNKNAFEFRPIDLWIAIPRFRRAYSRHGSVAFLTRKVKISNRTAPV